MSLKLENRGAPHIHHAESARAIMLDAVLAMVVIYAMAFYYYRTRVIMLAGVSISAAYITDVLCTIMTGKRPNIRDLSAVVTGMVIPLLMPASIPFHIAAAASIFAIAVAKAPFGGAGHNIFNPAAAGFAFAAICFPEKLFQYPVPLQRLPAFPPSGMLMVNSPAFTLKLGGVPKYDLVEMSLGNFPGPMGATNILVILACLLYLVLRGAIRWKTPVFFLLTASAFAYFFPRASFSGADSLLYEMMSGVILLGGVFMLGEPVTSPTRGTAQAAYAVMAGVIVMLFRRFGNLEEEFAFSLLLMNAVVWGFDMLGERLSGFIRRKRFENIQNKEIPKKT